MNGKLFLSIGLIIVLSILSDIPAQAWEDNGGPISIRSGDDSSIQLVADGQGGFFVVWQGFDDGTLKNILAQRFNERGDPVWESDLFVCNASGDQVDPRAVTDGAGGFYVVWSDYRSGLDVYGQHIFSDGTVQFASQGLAIGNAVQDQSDARIVADGFGGAVVVWKDLRSGFGDIYGQRFDATGAMVWSPGGLLVCDDSSIQESPELVVLPGTDSSNTRITVVWEDRRFWALSGIDIYAQRLTLDGVLQWGSSGLPVTTDIEDEMEPQVVASLSGSSIFLWKSEYYQQYNDEFHLQRLDRYGDSFAWDYSRTGDSPFIKEVGPGGVFLGFSYWDSSDDEMDYWVVRINSDGVADGYFYVWSEYGWDPYDTDLNLSVNSDGGFVVCGRTEWGNGTSIFARRYDDEGNHVWGGFDHICDSPGETRNPEILHVDEEHVVVAWLDERDLATNGTDIYAQRLAVEDGAWGYYPPHIETVTDIPGDQGGTVSIRITASDKDVLENYGELIAGYNVWRRVDDAVLIGKLSGAPLAHSQPGLFGNLRLSRIEDRLFALSDPASRSSGLPPGNWEVMGSFWAAQQAEYSFPAATLADSSGTIPWAVYCVTAHTTTPALWYASLPDSGYSVDNIAPGVPQNILAGYNSDGVSLDWDDASEEDFQYYRIYRDVTPMFVPSADNLVYETASASWDDPEPQPWNFHYKITTLDHAGNESEAGSPSNVTGVYGGQVPVRTALLSAVPNPFNPQTKIAFEVSKRGRVTLRVFDMAGRFVRNLIIAEDHNPGRHEVVWNGRDEYGRQVASGTYFYRIEAGSYSETKRMVLVK